jgi:putative FmdB family regulatory protein
MAIYEFQCEKCGKIHERSYPMTSKVTVVECDNCHGRCPKIISGGAFIVMGHNAANGYSKESEGL